MSIKQFGVECLEHIITNSPSNRLFSCIRYLFYKGRLKQCGGVFNSMSGVLIDSPYNISFGKNISIGRDSIIDASDYSSISIGNNCMIGPFVLIRAADHRFDNTSIPIFKQGHVPGSITIEDDCWIGGHVTITRNVTVGRGSVIGANSVVTKNIPPYSVAAGNPAVVIKSRLSKYKFTGV